MASSSSKDLLREYHRLAAEALHGQRHRNTDEAILTAAENGQLQRIKDLLAQCPSHLNVHCRHTGDTPAIKAARNGHSEVVEQLVGLGADLSLQNDAGEMALDLVTPRMREHLLTLMQHEDRAMSNAQALLQSAWLGDAVSVKKRLSGNHYIDVNCRNSDGMTPLLLVTRNITLFEQVQSAMESDYDPVAVMEYLLESHADHDAHDSWGRRALHLVASSESVQASKMVSLLMKSGSDVDCRDKDDASPLHNASAQGHLAIIVALVEEGGADINCRGGEKGGTPLMLSARGGHREAAQYLLAKGADVTAVDENGDSALTVAKSPSMVRILKEAWNEQTVPANHPQCTDGTPLQSDSDSIDGRDSPLHSDSSPSPTKGQSFFLTDRQLSKSLQDLDDSDHEPVVQGHCGSVPFLAPPSEVEADDEDEVYDRPTRRTKPATRRAQLWHNFQESLSKRKVSEKRERKNSLGRTSGEWRVRSLPRHMGHNDTVAYSSADEEIPAQIFRRSSHAHEDKPHTGSHRILRERGNSDSDLKARPSKLNAEKNESREKGTSFLPEMPRAPPSHGIGPSSRANRHSASSRPDKLPSLGQLRPVAMVTVDTDRDKLRLHKYGSHRAHGSRLAMQRSQSLMNMSSGEASTHDLSPPGEPAVGEPRQKKRNSTGSLSTSAHKVALVPNVVVPNAMASQTSLHSHTTSRVIKGRGRLQPLSITRAPSSPQVNLISPPLSIVNEDTESSSSDRTLTHNRSFPSIAKSTASGATTLKESSRSDFETDSLERHGVAIPSTDTVQSPTSKVFPPSQSSNVIVNYAPRDPSLPLSPIWNRMQYLRTDSESSSQNDYITSFIGHHSLHPHLNTPEPSSRKAGADSGHGESSDEDRDRGSSGSEAEGETGDREELKWKRGRLLGKGAYGKVWEGLMDSAKMIAVKEVELDAYSAERAASQYEKIQVEVEILRSLRHKNIVSYLGTSMQDNTIYIFMEYISGGSLQSILRRFGPLDARTVSHYTRQITRGLEYLHSNSIIHRDIKGANIMVTSRGVVKLIDFGCAKKYCQELSDIMHSVRGTPYWMAPEVICGLGYGRKSDIWSLGCTVHEMATTKPPWAELPPEAAMFQIGIGKAIPPPPDSLSSKITNFFLKCLIRDPTQRPSARELLEDSFLCVTKHKEQ